MSTVEMKNLESQLALLSTSERLSVMEYLLRLIKGDQEEKEITERQKAIQKIFAIMDDNPITVQHSSWKREELYER